MSKYNEFKNQVNEARKYCKFNQNPTYVDDHNLRNGDRVFGLMFDGGRRFWLVNR